MKVPFAAVIACLAPCIAAPACRPATGGEEGDAGSAAAASADSGGVTEPTSGAAPADAAAAAPAADDAGAPRWESFTSCRFAPVHPREGHVAEQCCIPTTGVSVCVATASSIHHHEIGPYTQRTLRVRREADDADLLTLGLDLQEHGSMRAPDRTLVKLSFRAHERGLSVSLAAGSCKGQGKRGAAICEGVGEYAWDGHALVRAPR